MTWASAYVEDKNFHKDTHFPVFETLKSSTGLTGFKIYSFPILGDLLHVYLDFLLWRK